MKKLYLTWMLLLVTAMAVHAQTLTGKHWCTVLNDDDGQGIAVALTFEKNGYCELVMATQQEMKEDGVPITIIGGVTVPGSYRRDGNDLNTQFKKGKASVDLDYEIKGLDAKTKARMDKQIRADLNAREGEFKSVMLNGMPGMNNLKIVSLEGKKLVVRNDDDQEIPFYIQ